MTSRNGRFRPSADWALAACVAVVALFWPGPVGGQWVESPGQGWVDMTVYHLDTREAFASDGEVREFFSDGHAVNTSVFLTLAGGLGYGVDAWVQVPYHRLRYDDLVNDRVRRGVGDTRVYLRTAPLDYFGVDFPFAVRGGVKLPVGDFAVNSEVIPLGDGQTDWELMAELGHSFYPTPAFVSGWVGYRWRERNEQSLVDFGDERFFLLQAGASFGRLGLQAVVEGWDGDAPVIEGVRVPVSAREMLHVTPSVTYQAGPGQLKVGARFPVAGKNLPAGVALVAGYFTGWSL